MGSELPLLEVMKLVHDPKGILHAFGTAIGSYVCFIVGSVSAGMALNTTV